MLTILGLLHAWEKYDDRGAAAGAPDACKGWSKGSFRPKSQSGKLCQSEVIPGRDFSRDRSGESIYAKFAALSMANSTIFFRAARAGIFPAEPSKKST
jgi:hypothetical protein